jgi:hypothetical protein
MISDGAASNQLKQISVSNIAGLGNTVGPTFWVNPNPSTSSAAAPSFFAPSALTPKSSPVSADLVVISDSAANGQLKQATVGSIGSAGSVASFNTRTGAVSPTAVDYASFAGNAGITNCVPTYSVSGSALVAGFLTIDTAATPSSSDQCIINMKRFGASLPSLQTRTVQAANAVTIGGTLGLQSNKPWRVWAVAVPSQFAYNGGVNTYVMGVINTYNSTNGSIWPLREHLYQYAIPCSSCTYANSPGVIYIPDLATDSGTTISQASPGVVTCAGSCGVVNGTVVVFTTTGTLPAPLVAGTPYYAVAVSGSSFNLTSTVGGSTSCGLVTCINTTSAGSPTHTTHIGTSAALPFRILGYAEWHCLSSCTAGTYTTPDVAQVYFPGVALPGTEVQRVVGTFDTAGVSTNSTTPQITGTTVQITPTSSANFIAVWGAGPLQAGSFGAAFARIQNGSTPIGPQCVVKVYNPVGQTSQGGEATCSWPPWTDSPFSTAQQTYAVYIANQIGGGAQVSFWNPPDVTTGAFLSAAEISQ